MDRSPVPAAADVDRHFQKPVFSRRLRLLGILLLLAAGTRLDTRVFAAPAPTAVPALAASDLQGLSPRCLRPRSTRSPAPHPGHRRAARTS